MVDACRFGGPDQGAIALLIHCLRAPRINAGKAVDRRDHRPRTGDCAFDGRRVEDIAGHDLDQIALKMTRSARFPRHDARLQPVPRQAAHHLCPESSRPARNKDHHAPPAVMTVPSSSLFVGGGPLARGGTKAGSMHLLHGLEQFSL